MVKKSPFFALAIAMLASTAGAQPATSARTAEVQRINSQVAAEGVSHAALEKKLAANRQAETLQAQRIHERVDAERLAHVRLGEKLDAQRLAVSQHSEVLTKNRLAEHERAEKTAADKAKTAPH